MTTLRDRMAIAIAAGHTPTAMARAADVESAAVSHWIAGRTKTLKAKSALGLAKLTGWNAEWWFSGKGPQDAVAGQVAAACTGTPGYLAELAAKLPPHLQEKLVAYADLLAGPRGELLQFQFSYAERAESPTKARARHQ
jgi:hypothetical protein